MVWTNQNVILYHGTQSEAMRDINQLRSFDLARCRKDVDFGMGLYTTTNEVQAEEWARRAARRFNSIHSRARAQADPCVIKFSCDRDTIARLESLFFVRPTSDYWELVRHCRRLGNHVRSATATWYDLVAGPVANADLKTVIGGYDQVSFHTPNACTSLYNSIVRR